VPEARNLGVLFLEPVQQSVGRCRGLVVKTPDTAADASITNPLTGDLR
jgi:hypothetical protein